MVWAGPAQEDHASGETGSSSDATFWYIAPVLNIGGGSIASEDKIASCETVHRARRALRYRVPVVHGAAIFSAPLEGRQRGVRVVDRGQRPLPELVEQGRLIVSGVGDGNWGASKSYARS